MFSRENRRSSLTLILAMTVFSTFVSWTIVYVGQANSPYDVPSSFRKTIQFYSLTVPMLISPICGLFVLRGRVKLKALLEENERLAKTDMLTGLSNRRSFYESFNAMQSARPDRSSKLAVIACDIDLFKRFNDSFGHQTGDEVLMHVAGVLKTVCPDDFILARTGGEEFAIAGFTSSLGAATVCASEFVRQVALTPLFVNGRPLHITISAGLCVAEPDMPLDDVVARADTAMYIAKNSGRNTFEIAA